MITGGGVFTQIRNASFMELGVLVSGGVISEKAIRNYYSSELKKARSRISKLKSEKTTQEFGKQDIPKFESPRNLKDLRSLLREVTDLNRFNRSSTSKISGLKEERESRIENLQEMGIDVDESNYGQWADFTRWYKNSEFSKTFEYHSAEVKKVFEESIKNGKATPQDWQRLFEKYLEKYEANKSAGTKY